tara:strand:- start:483 stop:707 length:225 start_codon:yes stop_codon:yes gene_type:complete
MGEQPVKNKTKEELMTIVDHLLKEIEILQDENKSLWFMLDEIHESDKAAKKLTDEQREKVLLEFLSKVEPVGDA